MYHEMIRLLCVKLFVIWQLCVYFLGWCCVVTNWGHGITTIGAPLRHYCYSTTTACIGISTSAGILLTQNSGKNWEPCVWRIANSSHCVEAVNYCAKSCWFSTPKTFSLCCAVLCACSGKSDQRPFWSPDIVLRPLYSETPFLLLLHDYTGGTWNIALHAVPAYRASTYLVSASQTHSTFPPFSPQSSTVQLRMK